MKKNKNLILTLKTFFLFCIVAYSSQVALAENINSYEYLKVEIDNSIVFEIEKEPNFNVNYFYLNSHFFPKTINETQYLNEFSTSHNSYDLFDDSNNFFLRYSYDDSTLKNKNEIENKFIIESTIFEPKIKNKEFYPIVRVSKENQKYLQYYDLIDVDEDIKNKASKLAENKDDTFVIATDIANWIQNDINYDLSTVTSNPDQKSTQTFQSKAGVCKEITNLYVSMLRSLGIPSRVVSGYAYTDSAEVVEYVGSNWGGHAWAEVLIDDVWVPFDLTYKQYGFVDASHLILKQNEKNNFDSISVNGSGLGFNIKKNSLKTTNEFNILDKREKITSEKFEIKLSGPNEISLDSYGYLIIDVKNLRDSYQVLYYNVLKTKEVQALDPIENVIVLKPNEEKKLYFRYKITNISSGYYTLPFKIYNNEIGENYNIQIGETYMRIKEIALPKYEEEQIQLSNNNIRFECSIILNLPQNDLICKLENPNNYEIENLNLCIKATDDCQDINLKLNEKKQVFFQTQNLEEIMTYSYQNKSAQFKVDIEKPILTYETNLQNSVLNINYEIENFGKNGLELNFYDENNTLIKSSNLDRENVEIPITKQDPVYTMKLEYKNEVFLEKSLKIKASPKTNSQETISKLNNASESFFSSILNWIIGLFK